MVKISLNPQTNLQETSKPTGIKIELGNEAYSTTDVADYQEKWQQVDLIMIII